MFIIDDGDRIKNFVETANGFDEIENLDWNSFDGLFLIETVIDDFDNDGVFYNRIYTDLDEPVTWSEALEIRKNVMKKWINK